MSDFESFFDDCTQGNPLLGTGYTFTGDIARDMYDNDIIDTVEGQVFLALAYISASNPVTAISWSLENWESICITVKYPRRFEVEMNGDSNNLEPLRGEDHVNGLKPVWVPNNHDVSDYGTYNKNNISLCPDPQARTMFRTIFNGRKDWTQIYIDFLNAFQTSGLTAGHVKSYMKWIKAEGIEGEYISGKFGLLSGGAPKIGDNPSLRNKLRNGKWTEYRSTFATITGIINDMFNELPSDYNVIFSQETRQKVSLSLDNPHSEKHFRYIPEVVLAYAYCWNVVTERKLEGLYSGKRAYEQLSYAHRESMSNILNEAKGRIKVWKSGVLSNVGTLPSALRDV